MAVKNGFTWDYVRNQPIAPRPAPYTPQPITPCAIRTAKATEFAKGSHITIGKQADSDKRRAMSKAAI